MLPQLPILCIATAGAVLYSQGEATKLEIQPLNNSEITNGPCFDFERQIPKGRSPIIFSYNYDTKIGYLRVNGKLLTLKLLSDKGVRTGEYQGQRRMEWASEGAKVEIYCRSFVPEELINYPDQESIETSWVKGNMTVSMNIGHSTIKVVGVYGAR
jgi:hypothetical protein